MIALVDFVHPTNLAGATSAWGGRSEEVAWLRWVRSWTASTLRNLGGGLGGLRAAQPTIVLRNRSTRRNPIRCRGRARLRRGSRRGR